MTGRQVLLERPVREGVDAHPSRLQQAGAVAQVFHEEDRIGSRVAVESQQPGDELPFLDVSSPGRIGLGTVDLVGQLLERRANRLLADFEELGEARLAQDRLPWEIEDHALPFP